MPHTRKIQNPALHVASHVQAATQDRSIAIRWPRWPTGPKRPHAKRPASRPAQDLDTGVPAEDARMECDRRWCAIAASAVTHPAQGERAFHTPHHQLLLAHLDLRMFHPPDFENLTAELPDGRLVVKRPIGTLSAQALVAKRFARPGASMKQLGVQAESEMPSAAHGKMLRAGNQPGAEEGGKRRVANGPPGRMSRWRAREGGSKLRGDREARELAMKREEEWPTRASILLGGPLMRDSRLES